MAWMEYQIRKLPYGVHRQLARILDAPGNSDWRAVIAVIPGDHYGPYEVSAFERSRSPTEALLQDLGQKCKTVKQLASYFRKINNNDALDVLGYHEPVQIQEQPASQPTQEGTRAVLKCQATGCPEPSYQWLKDGVEVPDGVDSELVLFPVKLSDHGSYCCIVSNRMNSEKTNVVELQVHPGRRVVTNAMFSAPEATHPPEIHTQPRSSFVAVGQPFQLHVEATQPAAFEWFKDSCRISTDPSSPALDFQPFQYHDEGNYTCRVYNSQGDELSNVATLRAISGQYEDGNFLQPAGFPGGGSHRPYSLTESATAKIALVIGNRDYMNLTEEDQPLVHTCNDAKQLASMLHKPQMGFKVISLINLTKAEMEQAVDIFCSLLGPGVYGLVYFAGHGFEQDGQNYLVPIDAEGGNWTPEEAVCVQAILKKMVGTNVELNIFLLDVCRKRTTAEKPFVVEKHEYPCNAEVVMGFATCPQHEAFERRCDSNGFYMKQLLPNVMNEEKVEDMLQKVTRAVAADIQELENTVDLQRPPIQLQMRPQIHSTTTRAFSLRDPIQPDSQSDIRRSSWLEIHKLPEKRSITYDKDITVEIRFEHKNWLSNVIVLCLRVVNLGQANFCDAALKLDTLPMDVQTYHFHPTTTNKLRQVVQNDDTVARSCPSKTRTPNPIPVERISEIYNIQRLKQPLTLTIEVKFATNDATDSQQTRYTVKAFACKEFGIWSALEILK